VFTAALVLGAVWWINARPPSSPQLATPVLTVASRPPAAQATRAENPIPPDAPEGSVADAPQPESAPFDEPTPALADLVSRVSPAVVTIQAGSARGSGFFVAADTVITNVHVVGGETTVMVRRADGTATSARVDTLSPAFDLAVLKVLDVSPTQSTMPLARAGDVRIGEEVIAIGTPLGFLQNTVSRGIVSGVRRVRGATVVQTDAAVNPGNSGGPLLDMKGSVIGVVNSGYVGGDGLSFAVSVDHVRAVLDGRPGPAPVAPSPPEQFDPLSPAVDEPADARRENATRGFEQSVDQLARRADLLDERWKSFAAQCYDGPIVGSFERGWFALWEGRAMQGAVAPGCVRYFNDLRRQADEVRQAVLATDEAARRADVYPGIRRDVLRRYRFAYFSR
jgi:S1-C subfamily serine protease